MPIYDYTCICGREFEAWHSVANRKTSKCECGELATQTVTACAFHLDPVSGDFPTRTATWAKAHERANQDDLASLGLRKPTRKYA